jgi:hypothetical protein
MNIHRGGDAGDAAGSSDNANQAGREALGAQAFRAPDKAEQKTESVKTTDNTGTTVESGMEQVAAISNGVENSTANKMERFANDPQAKADCVGSCRDALAWHAEQNEAQGVSPVAAQTVTAAFEAGLAKTT